MISTLLVTSHTICNTIIRCVKLNHPYLLKEEDSGGRTHTKIMHILYFLTISNLLVTPFGGLEL